MNCLQCGRPIGNATFGRRFCSLSCRKRYHAQNRDLRRRERRAELWKTLTYALFLFAVLAFTMYSISEADPVLETDAIVTNAA